MEVTKKYVINKPFECEKSELICETKICLLLGAGVGGLLNNVFYGKTPPRGSTIPFLTEKSTPFVNSRTSNNGHLSTTATFLADGPYIDSCLKPLNDGHFLLSPR